MDTSADDSLGHLIRQQYENMIFAALQKEQEKLIDYNSFKALSQYLLERPEISYASFQQLRETLPEQHRLYFTAKVFMACQPHPNHLTISSERLVRYIDCDIEMKRLVLDLLEHTAPNPDPQYITVDQLQSYLHKRIADIDPEHQMVASFHEFYTCTAVQRFLFHIDKRNTNLISLPQLIRSDVTRDFLDFIQTQQQLVALLEEQKHHGYEEDDRIGDEIYLLREKIEASWFSGNNAVNIYTTFLNLDTDHNGLLSLDEVMEFNGFTSSGLHLTRAAWRRVFEELVVFAPFELDYRGFVTLVLALEDIAIAEEMEKGPSSNPDSSQAVGASGRGRAGIRFFWNLVDFNRSAHLSPMKIRLFYADIEEYMSLANQVIPSANIMVTEVFDMVGYTSHLESESKQSHVKGPSFKQLLASKQCATLLMVLLDINSFWRYENRESQSAPPVPPPLYPSDQPQESRQEGKDSRGIKSGKSLEEDDDEERNYYAFDAIDEDDSLDALSSTLISSSSILNKTKMKPTASSNQTPALDNNKAKELINQLKQSSMVYDDEGDDDYDF